MFELLSLVVVTQEVISEGAFNFFVIQLLILHPPHFKVPATMVSEHMASSLPAPQCYGGCCFQGDVSVGPMRAQDWRKTYLFTCLRWMS